MSIESNVYLLLKTLCPNVYPDFAPNNTAKPFITYEQIGGRAIKPLNATVPNLREAVFQINVWSETRSATTALMLAVDAAMRTNTGAFSALPESEMMTTVDEETGLRGAIQDFVVRGAR